MRSRGDRDLRAWRVGMGGGFSAYADKLHLAHPLFHTQVSPMSCGSVTSHKLRRAMTRWRGPMAVMETRWECQPASLHIACRETTHHEKPSHQCDCLIFVWSSNMYAGHSCLIAQLSFPECMCAGNVTSRNLPTRVHVQHCSELCGLCGRLAECSSLIVMT